jgi:hypothetical protein
MSSPSATSCLHLEGRALGALAGDAVDVGGDLRRVVAAGHLGRQRHDDHGVVGLGPVAEVLQCRIDLEQPAPELLGELGARQRALDPDQRTGIAELLAERVTDVAVDQVDALLVGREPLLEQVVEDVLDSAKPIMTSASGSAEITSSTSAEKVCASGSYTRSTTTSAPCSSRGSLVNCSRPSP